jgi:hypothetical protein
VALLDKFTDPAQRNGRPDAGADKEEVSCAGPLFPGFAHLKKKYLYFFLSFFTFSLSIRWLRQQGNRCGFLQQLVR